jgi:hypothetical protein
VIIDVASYYDDNINSSPYTERPERPEVGKIQDWDGISQCECDDCTTNLKRDHHSKFIWTAYDNINPKETETLEFTDPITGAVSRHRYLLCPKRVIGFVLKSRNWGESSPRKHVVN